VGVDTYFTGLQSGAVSKLLAETYIYYAAYIYISLQKFLG